MIFLELRLAAVLTYGVAGLLLLSGFAFAQIRSSVGQFFVSITLNGAGSVVVPAGSCVSQTLFNQIGAVVRVTCVDNPFVSIAPSIDMQLPGTFGSTFRYPLISSSNISNVATAGLNSANLSSPSAENSTQTGLIAQSSSGSSVFSRNFNSPTSTVTDFSIYRTAPQIMTDAQGQMNMFISF